MPAAQQRPEGLPAIVVVGGCGHVGLPLGIAFALAGSQVTLLDTDAPRVAEVNAGHMPYLERGAEEALPRALAAGRLRATTDVRSIAEADVVIVTIGTPVDEFLDPGVTSFDKTLHAVLEPMRAGQLLVLRSTVFPGITERLARFIAETGKQVALAYCPERIAQGYALDELGKLPQIVAGASAEATARAEQLFAQLGAKTLVLAPVEAELAKLFSNAYRYLNFAISNQFYVIAQKFGADFNRIHDVVTADYPRLAGMAKAGLAGGPCLLKDTMQLAAFNHNDFALGQAAMMINEGLPSYLVQFVKRTHDLKQMTAAILGMAFKGNSDDPRASLSYKLRKVLALECRDVLCTDPYIDDPSFVPLDTALARADILFVGACHAEYRELQTDKPLVDVFSFVRRGCAS
ncbi:MAG: nucleotide sugar dehydrogenase [Pirellulales bacterium]|nr:nucleotide sugar dehydrogenase [Pirellulales bacterium]